MTSVPDSRIVICSSSFLGRVESTLQTQIKEEEGKAVVLIVLITMVALGYAPRFWVSLDEAFHAGYWLIHEVGSNMT